MARFCPSRAFILDLGGNGGLLSILFCPRFLAILALDQFTTVQVNCTLITVRPLRFCRVGVRGDRRR